VSNTLMLALRLLRRDWRAGELRVLVAALVIAVAAATAISFFTDRLGRAMVNQSADMLGADLALVSSRAVASAWLEQARQRGLRVAETLEFASVLLKGDESSLAAVKAVDDNYPLRGFLRGSDTLYGTDLIAQRGPQVGEIWLEPRLVAALQVELGEHIEIGASRLRLGRILTYEPGRAGDVYWMAPRALIHLSDLDRTEVVGPGSRLSYQVLFAGDETRIGGYKTWLQQRLGPEHNLLDIHEGRPAVGNAIDRAERYLGLSTLIAAVLAGVAIAMGARRYSERHYDVSAMLRCFGASQNDILKLYATQLLIVGIVGSALGCAVGWAAQHGLFALLRGVLPADLPGTGFAPVIVGFLTGMIVLAGFALPPVLRLKAVSPLRVLRRDLIPMPASGLAVYGAGVAAIVLLMWRYTEDVSLTLVVLAGTIAAAVALAALALLLLRFARVLRTRVGVAWRFGLNNLWRRAQVSVTQILAFGLTLMAMAVILLVRTDLLTTWKTQLPDDAPNHFAINIMEEQVDGARAFLQQHAIPGSNLYPMVRGRLIAINGVILRDHVSKEAANHGSVNRELNLTWSDTLPADNKIVGGRWWQPGGPGQAVVSVEQRLAARMNIGLDDRLTFSIGSRELEARVASIRTVQWDSFRPNFFFMFPPGMLDDFPATYITSFYMPPTQKPLLADFVRSFPSVTVLELDLIMGLVRNILAQVTLAVEYVLAFVLLAGFVVLYAALQASLDERLYEGALLRTLGASRTQMRAGHLAEFCLLGTLAGLLAAFGTEVIAWLMYTRVMDLDYSFKWQVWLVAPLVGAVLIGAAGYWGTRPVLRQSPLVVFREL